MGTEDDLFPEKVSRSTRPIKLEPKVDRRKDLAGRGRSFCFHVSSES